MKKLSFQKIFCFISILFIMSCCIFYGTRFIKLYIQNEKNNTEAKNSLAEKIYKNNEGKETFKKINNDYYFVGNATNNYLEYSNILWRIIKINNSNEILLISDSSLTSLAFGQDVNFESSYINKWLNPTEKEHTGILLSSLNNTSKFLTTNTYCADNINTIDNSECKENVKVGELSLLNTTDYANVGKDSYLSNNEYFYLANTTEDNKIWYISDDGKVMTSTGIDIIGVRPTIVLKANLDYRDGNGKKDDPYLIEDEKALFGSYVKLDNTMWRVYKVNDTEVRLSLNDYLMINNKALTYKYSNNSSYHNDTVSGSIAYYLNHDFLNSLTYKNKIKEVKWSNGYYGSSSNYDYVASLETEIDSKVALLSVGDVNLTSLEDYYFMTGSALKGTMLYTAKSNKKLATKYMTTTLNVIPTISIDKDLLTEGNGTFDSPYELG